MGGQASPLIRFLFIGMSVAIILAAMGLFSAFLNPVILAIFLAIIVTPIYQWLKQKGLPTWLALLIMIVGTTVIGLALLAFIFLSFRQLAASLSSYQLRWEEIKASLQAGLASLGLDPSSAQFLDLIDFGQLAQWLGGLLTGLGGFAATALFVVLTIIFAMLDASGFQSRLAAGLGADNPNLARLNAFGNSLVRYIVSRALVNLITGIAVAVMLLILGIDFAILWGVLTFFLSFIPYIGIFLATVPSVLLALFQGGVGLALVVILGVSIINVSAENLVAPKIVGKSLSISPFIVFLSFFFWSWLLGPMGMFLSMPITILIIFILNSFDESRWVAIAISDGPEQSGSEEAAAA